MTSHILIFKVLHGGDLSLRDNDGYTPFHLAAREGHLQAFADMLQKGIVLLVFDYRSLLMKMKSH